MLDLGITKKHIHHYFSFYGNENSHKIVLVFHDFDPCPIVLASNVFISLNCEQRGGAITGVKTE